MRWMTTNALCALIAVASGLGCGGDDETSTSGEESTSTGASGVTTSGTGTPASAVSSGAGGDDTSGSTAGTGGEGTGASGGGGEGTGGTGTGGGGTGGDGTGGGAVAPVGSSTGNIIECQPDTPCNDPCAETRDAGPGNCMVFVSNRYSMLVESNAECGVHVGLNFNGGSPAAGDYAVVGVNDYTAGTVAVDWNGGPDGSIEFAESGTVNVTIDGTTITGTFEDLPFPGGGSVSGEITCH